MVDYGGTGVVLLSKIFGRIKQRVVRAESSRRTRASWIFGIVVRDQEYDCPPVRHKKVLSFLHPMPTTIPPGTETEDDNEVGIQRISSGFSSGSPLDHTMDRIGMGRSDSLIFIFLSDIHVSGTYQRALLGLCGLGMSISPPPFHSDPF
jgi:hypothetical protein